MPYPSHRVLGTASILRFSSAQHRNSIVLVTECQVQKQRTLRSTAQSKRRFFWSSLDDTTD